MRSTCDGVAHGDPAVSGEDHQEERGGDLVDGGGGQVQRAHLGGEGPLAQDHGADQKRQP